MPGAGGEGMKASSAVPQIFESNLMKPFKLALIFTGHMVDLPDRRTPRFPPELEARAGRAIRQRLRRAILRTSGGALAGIASGARGGDILFLEGCRKAGIETRMILPFAVEHFLETSVRGTPGKWEQRFHALWDGIPEEHREVLTVPDGKNPYEVCNLRMIELAHELSGRVRLMALWDGNDRELKPGGTASFALLVRRAGGGFNHIKSEPLLKALRR
jgi:hypothetical protein